MNKKWVVYGVWVILIFFVVAFGGLACIPDSQLLKLWTEQQLDVLTVTLQWSAVVFSMLLMLIIGTGQLSGDSRAKSSTAQSNQEPVRTAHPSSDALNRTDIEPNSRSFTVISGSAQHIGAREEQQDAFCFSPLDEAEGAESNGVLAVLADGMGGLEMGQEASKLAVETMLQSYTSKASDEPVSIALVRSLQQANTAVFDLARQNELEWSVGTTLIAAVIREGQLYYVSAGDSRIYLYRDGKLLLLTRDHVYANLLYERVREGQLTMEEAESHPDRDLLTSYLGIPHLDEIDSNRTPITLRQGDWIMLCSDGLYGDLTEELLNEATRLSPQNAAALILHNVLVHQRQYQDNATIAILACY